MNYPAARYGVSEGQGYCTVTKQASGNRTLQGIDFPRALLRQIDAECACIGVTRQAWIKMACMVLALLDDMERREQSQGSGLKQQKYIDRARTQLGLHG